MNEGRGEERVEGGRQVGRRAVGEERAGAGRRAAGLKEGGQWEAGRLGTEAHAAVPTGGTPTWWQRERTGAAVEDGGRREQRGDEGERRQGGEAERVDRTPRDAHDQGLDVEHVIVEVVDVARDKNADADGGESDEHCAEGEVARIRLYEGCRLAERRARLGGGG